MFSHVAAHSFEVLLGYVEVLVLRGVFEDILFSSLEAWVKDPFKKIIHLLRFGNDLF